MPTPTHHHHTWLQSFFKLSGLFLVLTRGHSWRALLVVLQKVPTLHLTLCLFCVATINTSTVIGNLQSYPNSFWQVVAFLSKVKSGASQKATFTKPGRDVFFPLFDLVGSTCAAPQLCSRDPPKQEARPGTPSLKPRPPVTHRAAAALRAPLRDPQLRGDPRWLCGRQQWLQQLLQAGGARQGGTLLMAQVRRGAPTPCTLISGTVPPWRWLGR